MRPSTRALIDASAALCGAASAYDKYASRHKSVGKADPDPFFTTRVKDFKAAAERSRLAALAAVTEDEVAQGTMRERFERHMSDDGKWMAAVQRSGDGYLLAQTQGAWITWQACWALTADEKAVRLKIVSELRRSAFLHADVNKEHVLLCIKHGTTLAEALKREAQGQ